MEKEIERQRLLELERAKTNELRYNLDLEKEKQTQASMKLALTINKVLFSHSFWVGTPLHSKCNDSWLVTD